MQHSDDDEGFLRANSRILVRTAQRADCSPSLPSFRRCTRNSRAPAASADEAMKGDAPSNPGWAAALDPLFGSLAFSRAILAFPLPPHRRPTHPHSFTDARAA